MLAPQRLVARLARARSARLFSAAVMRDEPLAEDWTGGLYQCPKVTKSALPNGISCISTGEAASKMVAFVVSGGGGALGYAAKEMAFKGTNGASDLKTQRDLEVAGSIPYYYVGAATNIVAVSTTGESADEAVKAAALAVGVDREPVLGWELREAMHSKKTAVELGATDPLPAAVLCAAYGEAAMPPPPTVASVNAVEPAAVDAYFAACVSGPMTVVGVGLDHADLLAYATAAVAHLAPPPPKAVAAAAPKFVPGGLVTLTGAAPGAAAALPAPVNPVVADLVATAVGGDVTHGLIVVVAKGGPAHAKAALAKAASMDVAVAKATLKTRNLAATGADLVALIAGGFDPATYAATVDKVPASEVTAAVKAMLAVTPALAVVSA